MTEPPSEDPPPEALRRVDAASPDIVLPGAVAALPGEHRGGFATPPTAPVPLTVVAEHPYEPVTVTVPVASSPPWRPGVYALVFAIIGLGASILVGWAFPLGLIGLALGIVAVRRPDQRVAGVWAVALSAASLVYSAGWLLYAIPLI